VVAKASSEVHGKAIAASGNHVVYPENQAGCALARSLTKPAILDRFDLDPDNSIVELIVPDEFHGKTITELQLRSRYGLNLLAVSHDGKFEINPDPRRRLERGSAMVVIGCKTLIACRFNFSGFWQNQHRIAEGIKAIVRSDRFLIQRQQPLPTYQSKPASAS